MKKLALLFLGVSLLVTTGCNNSNDIVIDEPVIGLWQPVKEVVTTVEVGEQPISDVITYTDCQKQSRWWFSTEITGKRIDVEDPTSGTACNILPDKNFTYTYDKSGKTLQIKYQGVVAPVNTKVMTLDATTLNLSIREETEDPTIYKTRTITFKRVNPQS
ncbi:lipocalin family protein [Chryseobacterium indologenes]|uniref:lipocalin family protein n=1 Tax=Chryseobacterium TaxID=59732 RepID=UPI001628BB25|nr:MULTISPECIES: lipocalin family protein [Chryseobacterium]MDM1554281.1 lipocalin family protein [Chryseobacterium indologenes]WET47583.1 lipocalin family protein [Chryseobacterium indologenes]